MAGMIPSTGKSSGRKQWTLHDGPRGSLQRLRNQLAEDGCPESQVVLAKQLLEERCELDYDKNENARIAVYWLIKSSEQGHEEATHLLQQCFCTGRGINEHNYLDVKSCINMTQEEKLARKAAREMFASLANGEDFITSDQLQKRLIEIHTVDESSSSCANANLNPAGDASPSAHENGNLVNNNEELSRNDIDWSKRMETSNRKLTEDNIISAAVQYANGELPLGNQTLCLSVPNPRALDHIPYFHRSLLHPLLTLKIVHHRLVRFFGSLPYFPFFPIAKNNFQLLALLLIYCLINSESVVLFVPMVVYYLSFISMVVTTFQALQVQYNYSDFRIWSGLFLCYSGGSLNAEEAEFQFIRNNLKPFGHFFVGLLLNLMVYPTIAGMWIPQSEFTVVAFTLAFLTLVTFTRKFPDLLLLFSFGINILARYPYESDTVVMQGWRFLDLKVPSFASYVIGNGIEFCLNFRALFFLLIPVCFVKMAMREKGRGIYKYLVPHCLSLSWLQLAIIGSQGATMYGLLRGALALVGIVLFLPLAGLASFLLPICAAVNLVYESDYFMSLAIIAGFGLCVGISSIIVAKSNYSQYITIFQVSWGVIAVIILVSISYLNQGEMKFPSPSRFLNGLTPMRSIEYLDWEHYQKFCHQSSWEATNIASTQFQCAQLDGVPVEWEGYVGNVQIRQISNPVKNWIDRLPEFLRTRMYCSLGEKITNQCAASDSNNLDCYLMKKNLHRHQCHLDAWNKYQFEIIVKMASGVWATSIDVSIIADDSFRNFTMALKPGDKIWFRGTLSNAYSGLLIGGARPHVELMSIACPTSRRQALTVRHHQRQTPLVDLDSVISYILIGFKFVINFLLNPIVLYK